MVSSGFDELKNSVVNTGRMILIGIVLVANHSIVPLFELLKDGLWIRNPKSLSKLFLLWFLINSTLCTQCVFKMVTCPPYFFFMKFFAQLLPSNYRSYFVSQISEGLTTSLFAFAWASWISFLDCLSLPAGSKKSYSSFGPPCLESYAIAFGNWKLFWSKGLQDIGAPEWKNAKL
jgi:hypothetical protein